HGAPGAGGGKRANALSAGRAHALGSAGGAGVRLPLAEAVSGQRHGQREDAQEPQGAFHRHPFLPHRRHQRRQPADLPEPAQRDLRRRHLDRSGRPGQGARLGSDHAAGQRGLFAGRQPGRRAMSWDLPDPYVLELEVVANDIDELGHANNAVYVRWMERCAWSHSQSLGLDLAAYRQLDRAMAIVRHEVDYLAAAYQGERLRMGTWIV